MKTVLILVSLGAVLAGRPPCAPDFVAVPTIFETFTCVSNRQVEQMNQSARVMPDSVVRFLLWTERTKAGAAPEELQLDDLSALQNSSFEVRHPTRILVHGWLSDWTAGAVQGLAHAYIARGAYNVIGVDWSADAGTIIYPQARMRIDGVARTVAKQIRLLLRAGQQPAQIVLIGHSLGAHVAGLTGKHFQTHPKLAAVIALDPAGPLFGLTNSSDRVDRLDAEYVEVIHTNMGWLGHAAVLGQADFFPNGGYAQTGCRTNTCDHQRAVEYFRISLQTEGPRYIGRLCATQLVNAQCDGVPAVMGSDPDDPFKHKASGKFYLSIPSWNTSPGGGTRGCGRKGLRAVSTSETK